nr:MAG TPA: hypothetical protein [Caudoviricetes sp.]
MFLLRGQCPSVVLGWCGFLREAAPPLLFYAQVLTRLTVTC